VIIVDAEAGSRLGWLVGAVARLDYLRLQPAAAGVLLLAEHRAVRVWEPGMTKPVFLCFCRRRILRR